MTPVLPPPSPSQSYAQVQRDAARWPSLISEQSRNAASDTGRRQSLQSASTIYPLSPHSTTTTSARHRRLSSVTQASRDGDDDECLACLENQIERIRSARQSRLRQASDTGYRSNADPGPSHSRRHSHEHTRSLVPRIPEQHNSIESDSPRTQMLRIASRHAGSRRREQETRGRSRHQRPTLEASMQAMSISRDRMQQDEDWQATDPVDEDEEED